MLAEPRCGIFCGPITLPLFVAGRETFVTAPAKSGSKRGPGESYGDVVIRVAKGSNQSDVRRGTKCGAENRVPKHSSGFA
jgi:hypothetical protein